MSDHRTSVNDQCDKDHNLNVKGLKETENGDTVHPAASKMLNETESDIGDGDTDNDPDSTAVIIVTEGKASYESKALDGGWGWFVVLGCMLMHLLIGGLNRSYGVMYIELRRMFNSSAAVTAWVGGACVAVRMGLSPVATALCCRYSVRSVMIVGGLLIGVGMLISAFTPNTEFMFFSYSIISGLGGTLVYSPAIVLVGQYFHRLRGIAAALGSCGSGIGMFAFPPLIAYLFETFNYSGACLVLSAIMLNCCVSGALMRPLEMNHKAPKSKLNSESEVVVSRLVTDAQTHCPEDKPTGSPVKKKQFDTNKLKKQYFDVSLWKHPVFLSFALSQGFFTTSYFAGQMLLSDYAKLKGSSLQESVRVLSYLGIADTVGRLASGFVFDSPLIRPHRVHVYNVFLFISGTTCFLWAASNSYTMIVVVTVIHGLFTGSAISQRSVMAADLLGVERLPSAFGLTVAVQGAGLMVGPFIAGLIKDRLGSYVGSYIFCGASALIASVVYLCGSLCKSCRKQKAKDKTAAHIS